MPPLPIAVAALAAALPGARAHAALCPAAAPFEYARATPLEGVAPGPGAAAPADALPFGPDGDAPPIEATADRIVSADGVVTLEGDTAIAYRGRVLSAENARYDPASAEVTIDGALRFRGEGIRLESENARFDLDDERFSTGESRYEIDLEGRRAVGRASAMARGEDGRFALDGATYSSCPPGDESWLIRAREIRLDRERGIGTARGIVLNFKGVPIMAVPVFSFPIGPQRKTGFLAPSIGRSDSLGFELSIPWYWNIRPNLDATLVPRLTTRRGAILQSEARYLNSQGRWTLEGETLADRERDGERRSYARLTHLGRFEDGVTSRIEASAVSDEDYFVDLGNGLEAASITHLERTAELLVERGPVTALTRLQGFQTVDEDIASSERPYRRLPQVAVRAEAAPRLGLRAELAGEFVYFDRDDSVTGPRLDLQPRVSLPLSGEAWFLRPTFAHRFTHYRLNNAEAGVDRSINRNVPTFAVDGGLYFDRARDASGAVQTLEPRLYYLNVPYTDQSDIPLFDTAAFDFSISQLFRENRFSGSDRIADTEQLSLGLTTRFIDGGDGRERLRASVGQILYFEDRRVFLDAADAPAALAEGRRDVSDFVGELSAGLGRDWFGRANLQWNPDDDETVRGSLLLSFRPEDGRLVNLAHRVVNTGSRAETEQVDLSALWPIGEAWRLAGRWNYSLDQDVSIETLLGVEYDSCCWALRFAARRFIADDGLDHETSAYLQLVLKGLAPVGQNYGALLEGAILGYRDELD